MFFMEGLSPEQQKSNLLVPIAIIIAGALVALAIIYTGDVDNKNQQAAVLNADVNKKNNQGDIVIRDISLDDHIRGSLKAPIKIVEYSDTECPFCKKFHETMKEVVKIYGEDKVAWIYRHFPLDSLHSKSRKESEATECAYELGGNDGFWRYVDRLFELTPSNDGFDLSLLPKIAEDVDLNKAKFEKCLSSGKYAGKIENDLKDAIAAGGTGTPFNILISPNGEKFAIRGALPLENMKQIIDAVIEVQ